MATAVTRKRALYVALRNETYPRNSRIRAYLTNALDIDVDIVHLTPSGGYLRHCVELLRGGLRGGRRYDVVINAEFSLTFAWVAWVLAKHNRAVLVVDFFVGLVETLVVDRAIVQKRSFRARILGACDSFAAKAADILITDTAIRAERLSARTNVKQPALSLPVGAPAWARSRALSHVDDEHTAVRFLYYGNYVPLHGVPTLLQAVAAITPRVSWTLTMVGRGQDLDGAIAASETLGISDRTTFVDSVPESELADLIHDHDVVLGIFGQSDKAATVIANKVWQGLACGKVVVTRRSVALEEIAATAGSLLKQVDGADAASITSALTDVAATRSEDFATVEVPSADIAQKLEDYVTEKYDQFGSQLRRELGDRR